MFFWMTDWMEGFNIGKCKPGSGSFRISTRTRNISDYLVRNSDIS
ncbi:hypothetical protein S1OALGB6SA_880 [Olavius algarvensis spirochete endosymbiont]|nr:MAG: hypothetical protein [Olavius algarvensis spirochete endosymbiont]VDA99807.1 hypothetical protein S1OALGB6SA_880 [Olavius algarvensis spirochete endosymbiont]